jgi:hypothetical protein
MYVMIVSQRNISIC